MTSVLAGWSLDTTASTATFAVRSFGVHVVRGRIPIRHGVVELDDAGKPRIVRARLDLTGIDTGNRRRDRDLAKPGLLDTRQWPELSFEGQVDVRLDSDGRRWKVPGVLAGHGTSTEITLDVEVTDRPDVFQARATASFDRRALGIRAPRLVIGRHILVLIDVVLRPTDLPPR